MVIRWDEEGNEYEFQPKFLRIKFKDSDLELRVHDRDQAPAPAPALSAALPLYWLN